MMIKRSTQIFLALMALAFIKTGIESLLNPQGVLSQVGIELDNISALSSMRAVYGGMHLVFGIFCLSGLFVNSGAALQLILLYTAGFSFGRIFTCIVDGAPNSFVMTWMVIEIVCGLIAGALLLRIRSQGYSVERFAKAR